MSRLTYILALWLLFNLVFMAWWIARPQEGGNDDEDE